MANYFYLRIGTDTSTDYVLDTNAISITFPGMNRSFTQVDLYSNQSAIQGAGQLQAGQIVFSRKFRKGTSPTAWNTARDTILKIMTLAKYSPLYFYALRSDGKTVGCQIYPVSVSGESYTSFAVSADVSFHFAMVTGYYQNVAASTDTKTMTGTTMDTKVLTNGGTIATTPVITFTPSTTFTSLQVQLASGYGFKLVQNFASGIAIVYDCGTGILTVGGFIVAGGLASGSTFRLEPGANTLQIWACAGAMSFSWYERFI